MRPVFAVPLLFALTACFTGCAVDTTAPATPGLAATCPAIQSRRAAVSSMIIGMVRDSINSIIRARTGASSPRAYDPNSITPER